MRLGFNSENPSSVYLLLQLLLSVLIVRSNFFCGREMIQPVNKREQIAIVYGKHYKRKEFLITFYRIETIPIFKLRSYV